MNEELQSTNDELQTINDALRERTRELDRVNEFLESILTSLRAGVIVLDPQMRVLAWNRGAEEMYGWSAEEALGQSAPELLKTLAAVPLEQIQMQVLRTGRW